MQIPEPLIGRIGHVGGIEPLIIDGTMWFFGYDYSLDAVLSPLIDDPVVMAKFAAEYMVHRDGKHDAPYWLEWVGFARNKSMLAAHEDLEFSTADLRDDPHAITDHLRYLIMAAQGLCLGPLAATADMDFSDLPGIGDDLVALGLDDEDEYWYETALEYLEFFDEDYAYDKSYEASAMTARRIIDAYRTWAAQTLPANWPMLFGYPPREQKSGPTLLLGRSEKIFDAKTRVPSTAAEVAEVCRQIAGTSSSTGSSVRLSGIDWRVLDIVVHGRARRALLLSDPVIGRHPYHKTNEDITWEHCDLRRWLNNEFCQSLGEPLLSRVLATTVHNGLNPAWGTPSGDHTTDQFFLLGMKEAIKYLSGERNIVWKKLRSRPFEFGNRGEAQDEDGRSAWWWLRSSGSKAEKTVFIDSGGKLKDEGYRVSAAGGVRPVFWLNFGS
ncbi:MAG: DUF6273 domain-containing protein [Micrococcales bacterium]|nr:DUF6273 domain-containing protein [Micrococcales bacterium]MCL2668293.1 DUF6273 domain-containing protein [Micrococcales bacterium]